MQELLYLFFSFQIVNIQVIRRYLRRPIWVYTLCKGYLVCIYFRAYEILDFNDFEIRSSDKTTVM